MNNNTDPNNMWVISQGEYSDYRVLAICASKELADAQVALITGGEDSYGAARVEEMMFLAEVVQPVVSLALSVTIWDDGATSHERESMRSDWPWEFYGGPVSWRWVRAPIHNGKGGRLDVNGTDLERVRRVFSDRRAELLATPSMAMRKEIKG